MPPSPGPGPNGGKCPFCGLTYVGAPNQCGRCGTLLGEAVEDIKRLGEAAKRDIRTRKALSDVLFLVGLLLGGPMMSFGGEIQLGLFIVLAGGFASVLRRYTDWSAPGTVAVGGLGAALVATLLFDPAEEAVQEVLASEASREAFVTALGEQREDILVQSRGPGSVTVWFTVPEEISGECGEYPDQGVRAHLATLGFLRIVVQDRSQEGGICSFRP